MSTLSSVALLPVLNAPAIASGGPDYSRPDLAAIFDDFLARWQRQTSAPPATPELDDGEFDAIWRPLNKERDDVAREILNITPVTIADLVLQARACALANEEYWTCRVTVENFDFGTASFRILIDRICAFGNVEALAGIPKIPVPDEYCSS